MGPRAVAEIWLALLPPGVRGSVLTRQDHDGLANQTFLGVFARSLLCIQPLSRTQVSSRSIQASGANGCKGCRTRLHCFRLAVWLIARLPKLQENA